MGDERKAFVLARVHSTQYTAHSTKQHSTKQHSTQHTAHSTPHEPIYLEVEDDHVRVTDGDPGTHLIWK